MAQDRLRYTWIDYDPGPTYDADTFDLDHDFPRLFTKGFIQAPSNPDLTDFKRRGGKLITYSRTQRFAQRGAFDRLRQES